ncbi:hypothetical protein M9Y10_017238, partial [Tritrichomonas musculus]
MTELNAIRDDYDLMLLKCNDLGVRPIPFFVTSDDINIVNKDCKHMKQLIIEQPDNILIYSDYYCDYLITPDNDDSYEKVYVWDGNHEESDYMYPYLRNSRNVDFDEVCFIHGSDTRNFLNI